MRVHFGPLQWALLATWLLVTWSMVTTEIEFQRRQKADIARYEATARRIRLAYRDHLIAKYGLGVRDSSWARYFFKDGAPNE